MLGRVLAIAFNTYRESVRARILIGLAGVAFAISFYSLIVGAWTLDNAPRVVSDLGTASMSIFSIAVAILIGATSLHRELEQKTVFPILARPIHRAEYLVGKFAGTMLTMAVFIMADAGLILLLSSALHAGASPRALWRVLSVGVGSVLVLAGAMWKSPAARTFGPIPWAFVLLIGGALLAGGAPDERRVVLGASALAFCEVAIVAAVATLFASFSTPFLSALLTLLVWIVGRQADALARMPVKYVGQFIADGGKVVAKIWPNLQVYVPPRPLLTGEAPDVHLPAYLGSAALAACAWAVLLLAVASFIFKRRDFL